jgi:hypothetical protein
MRVEKREFTWEFPQHSLLDQTRTRVAWELRSESLHYESFLNIHCLIKREQELHDSMRVEKREFTWGFSQHSLLDQTRTRVAWELRVYMRVFSTFIAWSNENKSCMRVEKREFTWEFSQHSLLDKTRTRVAWELRGESLHESFLNIHCLIKQEQELHERREFTWEFSEHSLLDQTRTRVAWELTSESLHESFLNFHCLIKREQLRVAWELRSESFHESFVNIHCLIKREQELHESWQARVYMKVFSTFIAWPNENKSCMRIDRREFTWEFLNFHCLIKREQELHESWYDS